MKSAFDDAGKTVKSTAKQAARQVVREPLEILKDFPEELFTPKTEAGSQSEPQEPKREAVDPAKEQKLKMQSKRILEALEKEIEDIKRQKEYVENQKKQEEEQNQVQAQPVEEPVSEPLSKKGRRMMGNVKKKVQQAVMSREMRPTETRKPVSG